MCEGEEWDAWSDCRVLLKVLMDGDNLGRRGVARSETSCGHAAGDGTIVGLSGGWLHDGAMGGLMALRVAPFLYHLRSRAEDRPEKAWVGDPRGLSTAA